MIIFEWYRYSSYIKKRGKGRLHYYWLPVLSVSDGGNTDVKEILK
jgi:hypothetical protein